MRISYKLNESKLPTVS